METAEKPEKSGPIDKDMLVSVDVEISGPAKVELLRSLEAGPSSTVTLVAVLF